MEETIKLAVTITTCRQIGEITWQDSHTTKVFEESATIKSMNDWVKTVDKNSNLSNAKISICVE